MLPFHTLDVFTDRPFHGNPLAVHEKLHEKFPLKLEHFVRWIEIFGQTLDSLFEGETADAAKLKAEMIGHSLNQRLNGEVQVGVAEQGDVGVGDGLDSSAAHLHRLVGLVAVDAGVADGDRGDELDPQMRVRHERPSQSPGLGQVAVEYREHTALGFELGGRLMKSRVVKGEVVKEGALLGQLALCEITGWWRSPRCSAGSDRLESRSRT